MRELEAQGYVLNEIDVQSYLFQLLQGLKFMHDKGLFHRDLKPENLLLRGDTLKIADFGLAKEIASNPQTEYRAPELLLKAANYTAAVDIWAVGTILAEMTTSQAIFPGESEIDQLFKICLCIGSPVADASPSHSSDNAAAENEPEGYYLCRPLPEDRKDIVGGGAWPEGIKLADAMGFTFPIMSPVPLDDLNMAHAPVESLQLMADMFLYDPAKRPTASQALRHPWFDELHEAPDTYVEAASRRLSSNSAVARSREDTVCERPSASSRRSSRVHIEDVLKHSRDSTATVNDKDTARRNSKLHFEDVIKRRGSSTTVCQSKKAIDDSMSNIEKEKLFIRQRRELSALEKMAVEAVKSLAEKQKQLQKHLDLLAPKNCSLKATSKAKGVLNTYTDAKAVNAVNGLVKHQKSLQRNIEQLTLSQNAKKKRLAERLLTSETTLGESTEGALALHKKSHASGEQKKQRDSSPTSRLVGVEFGNVLDNIEEFGNAEAKVSGGKIPSMAPCFDSWAHAELQERQTCQRLWVAFMRNVESEAALTADLVGQAETEEEHAAGLPRGWRRLAAAHGARLRVRIGELVALYNEFVGEVAGVLH
ncbi:hypothetical protein HDU82_007419 [Entophlyctis luteolus]|nr:hypothetical protein HDU82_007419 [Entophlyctis luteolus]